MRNERSRISRGARGALVLALLLALASRVAAIDFIRGDVNGDGIISVADIHAIEMLVYGDAPAPQCLMAADVDDDDYIGYSDAEGLRGFLFWPGFWPEPSPPYPGVGPDPTEAVPDPESPAVTCERYGGGSVLDDPASRIEIRDAVAAGGREAVAVLKIALTSSWPTAGFVGRLRVEGDIIGHHAFQRLDVVLADDFNFWSGARDSEGSVVFYAQANLLRMRRPLPEGDDVDLATLTLCLRPGARAGTYPITLETAEIVEWGTARSIRPTVAAGTLTLLRDVASTADWCSAPYEPGDPVEVEFRIGDAVARPGGTFRAPLTIRSAQEFYGYGISIDFNEEVLECTGLELVWQRPDGLPYAFESHDLNNRSVRPGNGGPDEGAVVGLFMLWTFLEPRAFLPADADNVPLALDFRVRAGVPAGTLTRIHVRSGQMGARAYYDEPWLNGAEILGRDFRYPTNMIAGLVEIVDEDSEYFCRGDSNGDDRVEVSDAVHTLEHLFLGGPAPRCADAADSNDSGDVNIADPIDTLSFLFLGRPDPLPPPFPGLGKDPTPDGLACGVPAG